MTDPADRLRTRYELRLARGESARTKAAGIAREQTVEIAPGIAAAEIEQRTIGRVVSVAGDGRRRARATIDYPWRELVSDLPQLLNLLFGNVSLQRGVRVVGLEWPEGLLARFPGPRFGAAGVRELLGVADRPLLATVLKPVGLTVRELAVHAADCALAGVDLVKDDHSLADQPAAPFRERVLTVAETIRRAARRRGGRTLYFPNLTGPVERLAERLEDLREAGVEGAIVAPAILGLDTLRSLAESSGLVLLAHPAMTGAFFAPGHGFAPALFYGELLRVAGADIVNLPLPDGRFAFSRRDFDATLARLAAPLGAYPDPLPMLAGGVDERRLARWLPKVPRDAVFLVGGELYRGGRTRELAERLVRAVDAPVSARRSGAPPRRL